MKRPNISKGELFRKIFATSRRRRSTAIYWAWDEINRIGPDYDQPTNQVIASWAVDHLNRAAPVRIDLGGGPIACASFGSAQNGKVSYRPLYRRPDCTALVGGINLSDIKSIKLF